MSVSGSESDGTLPRKRARGDDGIDMNGQNHGHGGGGGGAVLPPLSPSLLGVEPLDELVREVADFVHGKIGMRAHDLGDAKIEVEGRVGVIRERGGGGRIGMPVVCETVLHPDYRDIRFESNMSAAQHKHFNQMLNGLKLNPSPHSKSPIEYKHQYLVDSFYDPEGNDRDKVRVTRDERSGAVLECVRKTRLGDLNVFCPKRNADFRVSVNVEQPVLHPVGSPVYTRKKDRIAYSHEEFTIDLTQVVSNSHGQPETSHELEIEVTRSDYLLAAAERRDNPNVPEEERIAFDEIMRAFVNNIRILVRNTP